MTDITYLRWLTRATSQNNKNTQLKYLQPHAKIQTHITIKYQHKHTKYRRTLKI